MTSTLDSRRPAIAGAAQCVQRVDDPRDAAEPIALMEQALRSAAEDAGAPKLLEALDAILVPQGLWKYGDPGSLLAQRVGAPSVKTGVGAISGHIVQVMIDWACREISAGRHDVVAVVGGESENSKRRLAKQGAPVWNDQIEGEPDERFGARGFGIARHEIEAGIRRATVPFALCDTSLRASRGETPAQHRVRISELSSRMSAVAAANPHAWIRRHISAEEIRTPTPENRMVSYPYTKLMTSNIAVDQSAALIVCSAEAAQRYGVEDARLVHLRAATEMSHTLLLSERQHLHVHPGMEIAGKRVLELADIDASELSHVDLYSCFPFAVQAGAAAVGLSEEAALTVTGGLTFSGGPFGNYVLQSTAQMVELVRSDPGSFGMVGSIGGNFAKFAYGIYCSEPGEAAGPVIQDVGEELAALSTRAYHESYTGAATVESYTVDVEQTGRQRATFSALCEGGERVWASSEDPALMEALISDEDACGRAAKIADGRIQLD